jgi:hypothetical protein
MFGAHRTAGRWRPMAASRRLGRLNSAGVEAGHPVGCELRRRTSCAHGCRSWGHLDARPACLDIGGAGATGPGEQLVQPAVGTSDNRQWPSGRATSFIYGRLLPNALP